MNGDTWIFLALCGALLVFLLAASFLSKSYSLDRIKSKTVGDGQHGTARWATPKEISKTYHTVPFRPRRWRKGKELPTEQGLILGSVGGGKRKSKGGSLLKISRRSRQSQCCAPMRTAAARGCGAWTAYRRALRITAS